MSNAPSGLVPPFTDQSGTRIPTGRLRFSLRYQDQAVGDGTIRREVRILQAHALDGFGRDVWTDVPTVDHRERADG